MSRLRVLRPETAVFAVALAIGAGCSFEGIRTTDAPPSIDHELQLAVGPNQIVQLTGGLMRVFAKNGEIQTPGITVATLTGCTSPEEPHARYDPGIQRFYVVAGQATAPTKVCLAVSNTNDPNGAWTQYQFPLAVGLSPDFVTVGFSDDKVGITANQVQTVPGQGPTPGWGFWALNRSQVAAGGSVSSQFVFLGNGPAFVTATSLSATNPLYIAGYGQSVITILTATGVPGVGGGVTVSSQNVSFTLDPIAPAAPQKGSIDQLLVTTGTRDVIFRNGSLWMAGGSACIPAGDTIKRGCLRIVQLPLGGGGTFSISQDIEYGQNGYQLFYPSIVVDVESSVTVGFGVSSPAIYPSFWVTGRKFSDAANTLRAPDVAAAGQQAFDDGDAVVDVHRWGLYFGASHDPSVNQGKRAWLLGQYASFPKFTYGTRIQLIDNGLF